MISRVASRRWSTTCQQDAGDVEPSGAPTRRSRYQRRKCARDSERQVVGTNRHDQVLPRGNTQRDHREVACGVETTSSNAEARGRMQSARRRSGWRTLRSAALIPARAGEPATRWRLGMPGTSRTPSLGRRWLRSSSTIEGRAWRGRTPREIEVPMSASRSTRRTERPRRASSVATFTAVCSCRRHHWGFTRQNHRDAAESDR